MNELLSNGGTVIANHGDCVNGYNDIKAYHSHETQAKASERIFQHMEAEIADLRQEENQLLKLVEKLTHELASAR